MQITVRVVKWEHTDGMTLLDLMLNTVREVLDKK